jgi:hypothetical protein
MASRTNSARHVFHPETTGSDRVDAWQVATGEPAFIWGRHSGQADGAWFGSVKRDFENWLNATTGHGLTIYHDGAGVDALGPMDPNADKVLFLHQFNPRWERNFEWMIRCAGRVLTGSEDTLRVIKDRFAWIPAKHTGWVESPHLKDGLAEGGGTGAKQRTGIWLHGKPWKRHGNRLRSIIDRWSPDIGELEIIATGGPAPGWARKEWIKWSNNLPLEFALLRLHTWDSTLLLNDYALDAPWLIKAISLGCFPIVPDGNSPSRTRYWGGESAPRSFEWGDSDSAKLLLSQWRENREALRVEFDGWAQSLVTGTGEDFSVKWRTVKEALLANSAPRLRSRKSVRSLYPVQLYERVQRIRSGS